MLIVERKSKFANVVEVYFKSRSDAFPDLKGEQFYVQRQDFFEGANEFKTTCIDLRSDLDFIWSKLSKNFRYEINRARDKDRVVAKLSRNHTEADLRDFFEIYKVFAISKGLKAPSYGLFCDLNNSGGLVISQAFDTAGELLAAHAYLTDGNRVRLLFSASARYAGNEQLIGRGNKFLHWEMIAQFQRLGLKIYDFGGLSDDPKLETINKFKNSFGGLEVVEYNGKINVGFMAKIVAAARGIAKKGILL